MPVKRRKSKARPDELKAWDCYFRSGFEFFGGLVDAGIIPNVHAQPDEQVARDAWRRLGADFLAGYTVDDGWLHRGRELDPPYALRVFGEPQRARGRSQSRTRPIVQQETAVTTSVCVAGAKRAAHSSFLRDW